MTNLFSPLLISFCTLFWLGAATADQEWKGDGQPLTLKILSYNVRNGVGLDKVTDYHRIASIFNRMEADAIAIQELDSATTRSKGVVVLTELAAKTGMYPTYSSSIDYQGGKYGVGEFHAEQIVIGIHPGARGHGNIAFGVGATKFRQLHVGDSLELRPV
jgi:hypothetical protein